MDCAFFYKILIKIVKLFCGEVNNSTLFCSSIVKCFAIKRFLTTYPMYKKELLTSWCGDLTPTATISYHGNSLACNENNAGIFVYSSIFHHFPFVLHCHLSPSPPHILKMLSPVSQQKQGLIFRSKNMVFSFGKSNWGRRDRGHAFSLLSHSMSLCNYAWDNEIISLQCTLVPMKWCWT